MTGRDCETETTAGISLQSQLQHTTASSASLRIAYISIDKPLLIHFSELVSVNLYILFPIGILWHPPETHYLSPSDSFLIFGAL